MSLKAVIGALRVNLSANTAAFTEGMNRAKGSVSGFVGKVGRIAAPVAAIGTALGAAGLKAAQTAKEIDRLAELSGAGIKEFQRASYAAQSVGIEQEKLADIFKDTNDKIGDFIATGGGELKDFFENIAPKVGMTAEDFKKLSGPEALQAYVSALQKAGVSQKEMVFYMEAIADEGSALLPLLKNNGKAMGRLGDEAESLGVINEKQAETAKKVTAAWRQIKGAFRGVVVAIVDSGLIDLLAKILEWNAKMIPKVVKLGKELVRLAQEGIAKLIELANAFVELKDRTLQAVADMVNGVKDWFGNKLQSAAQGARDFRDKVLGWFYDTEDEAVGHSIIPDMVRAIGAWMGKLPKVGGDAAEGFSRKVLDGFGRMADAALDSSRSIGDAAKSIIADFAKIAAEGAIMGEGPLGGFLTDFLGGSLKSGISSLFSGGGSFFGSVTAAGTGMSIPLIPKLARGTSFHSGGPAIVGEEGPELVSMPRGSRVSPNGEYGGVQINVDARGSNDPAQVEAAGRRGAEAALTRVRPIVSDMRRRGEI